MVHKDNSVSENSAGHLAGLAKWLLGNLPQDIIGLAGADWLREFRIRNIVRVRAKAEEKLNDRMVDVSTRHINPSLLLPLLTAAEDRCDDDNLLELWGRLLANAMDPSTASLVRKAHIELLEKLDTIDAKVMNFIWENERESGGWESTAQAIAEATGLRHFDVCVSFAHLESLKVVTIGYSEGDRKAVSIMIGTALYSALRSPTEEN